MQLYGPALQVEAGQGLGRIGDRIQPGGHQHQVAGPKAFEGGLNAQLAHRQGVGQGCELLGAQRAGTAFRLGPRQLPIGFAQALAASPMDAPGLMQPQEAIDAPLLQGGQQAKGAKPPVSQQHLALG